MDVELQARTYLGGQRIDLEWTWRSSGQESTRSGFSGANEDIL